MMPNVFTITAITVEDRVTAYWHYVLSVVPGLGQAFADEICRLSGLPPTKFLGAIDHPSGDGRNHPDLLIQGEPYSILFEHKIDAPLGSQQLQRYLQIADRNRWKLALLAGSRISLAPEVAGAASFVAPSSRSGRPEHFLWQDLFPVLRTSDHHLAREFGDLLEALGLGKFSWAGIGNPFTDRDAEAALRRMYDVIPDVFRGTTAKCSCTSNSLVYRIQTPFHPIHLINLGPMRSVAEFTSAVRGPVMAVWVWVRRSTDSGRRVLPTESAPLEVDSEPVLIVNQDGNHLRDDRRVFAERWYFIPLDQILRPTLAESEERLTRFVRAVAQHLDHEVAGLPAGTGAARRGHLGQQRRAPAE